MRVDAVEFEQAAALITAWCAEPPDGGRYVCAGNVHMTMEARRDPAFRRMVDDSALVLPDGVPLVWALRALGLAQRRRVRVTPDLLLELFVVFEEGGVPIGLYGGAPDVLGAFRSFLATALPRLDVAYTWSPPFRPLTPDEDATVVRDINASGAKLLLVGLGCPKQERWMAAHAGRLDCVMFGVGAAFDMFGGRTRNAPAWMRDRGLEWAFRVASEPRRLWRRHVLNDPLFLVLLAAQVAREHLGAGERSPA
jgi:N-acetylglucosaminyldiphosphoundecaprenol N-acetyl-beta-D-mannosaminyltransferase